MGAPELLPEVLARPPPELLAIPLPAPLLPPLLELEPVLGPGPDPLPVLEPALGPPLALPAAASLSSPEGLAVPPHPARAPRAIPNEDAAATCQRRERHAVNIIPCSPLAIRTFTEIITMLTIARAVLESVRKNPPPATPGFAGEGYKRGDRRRRASGKGFCHGAVQKSVIGKFLHCR